MQIDFDDDIPDLTGKGKPVARKPLTPRPPLNYIPMEKRFTEPCPKCRGSGRFFSAGPCFNCKGSGKKSYKTPPAVRAKARAVNAAKTQERRAVLEETAARLRKFYGQE